MTDQNCAYCMEGDLVAQFGIKICELPSSKVYLFKEQSHKGRVIVAHKKHVSEIGVVPIFLVELLGQSLDSDLVTAFVLKLEVVTLVPVLIDVLDDMSC